MFKAKNMSDVIKHHTMKGYHFFDEDTMRFWGSKIESELFNNGTFVTSEDNFNRTERLYSVRLYNSEDATIDTIVFQKFTNRKDAIAFAVNW